MPSHFVDKITFSKNCGVKIESTKSFFKLAKTRIQILATKNAPISHKALIKNMNLHPMA